MFNQLKCTAFITCMVVSGCSTKDVTPDIESFGQAVSVVAKKEDKTAKASGLGERFEKARRADLVAAGAAYKTNDSAACSYNYPSLERAPPSFETACRLIPVNKDSQVLATRFDPLSVQDAADLVVETQDEDILKEYLVLKIRHDLANYADAIGALSKSELPGEIGASTAAAFKAATGLHDAVAALSVAQNKGGGKLKEVGTLASLAATEIAETARYQRLRSVVTFADPFVQKAAVQLSLLAFEKEKPGLEEKYQTLDDSFFARDIETTTYFKTVEDAYEGLNEADNRSVFRLYSEIGVAHDAIVRSLGKGASVEELAAANGRILKLAKAVKAVIE